MIAGKWTGAHAASQLCERTAPRAPTILARNSDPHPHDPGPMGGCACDVAFVRVHSSSGLSMC
eukprot:CAMPEP_0204571456 /NCGR_PEP_ID=MMETSP0661-20131031/38900_1 /ASSEMBLY_ACC=CAM_ASM_000606 /TAXON_ID=109239 /ORGANISM="Alexandrium margalefi, Strain AMGDE01CS-322" /LENGTH=62 /DNA_ID=CAMNT_0051579717 /DNA_START=165 /DNA_END=350 /DNA_ORIENTATION=+